MAYLVAAVPAVTMSVSQPLWSRVDEAQHADVLAQYAHASYPVAAQTTLRPEIVSVMKDTGVYGWGLPTGEPRPSIEDAARFTPPPAGLSRDGFRAWMHRHTWWFSYEAMQPPLFYLVASPVWQGAGALGGTYASIYAVRLLNALLLAMVAPLVVLLTRLMGAANLSVAAAATVAVLPGLAYNATSITNDTLAVVLGSATLVISLRGLLKGWNAALAVACGLTFGGALMSKLTAFGLAPAVVFAFGWPALRGARSPLRQLGLGLLAAAIVVAISLPWLLLNLHLYGQPVPSRAAAQLVGGERQPLSLGYAAASLKHIVNTFWTGEPHDTLPIVRPFTLFAGGLAVVATAGILRGVWRRRVREPLALWMLLLAAAGALAWSFATIYAGDVGAFPPGRYLYPAVGAAAVLFALGLEQAGGRLVLIGGVAAFAGLALFDLGAFAAGSRGPGGTLELRSQPPADAVHASLHGSGELQGVEIQADDVAVEPGGLHGTWIHLLVENRGATPAEWFGKPFTGSDGIGDFGTYCAFTPFPQTLVPGSRYTGWVELRKAPALVPGHQLIFADLTSDGYRSVGTLEFPLARGQAQP